METYIDYTETALIILAGVATTSLAECIVLIIIFIIKKKIQKQLFHGYWHTEQNNIKYLIRSWRGI